MPIPNITPALVPFRVSPETSQAPTVIPYHVPGNDADRLADTDRVEPFYDGVTVKLADNPLLFDAAEFQAVRDLADVEARILGLERTQTTLSDEIARLTATQGQQAATLATARANAEAARIAVPSATAALDGVRALTGPPSLNAAIGERDRAIAALDAQIAALGDTALRQNLVAELATLTRSAATLATTLVGAEAKLSAANARLVEAEAAIAAIDAGPQTPESAAQRTVLATQREAASAEVSALLRQVADITAALTAGDADVSALHGTIEALDATLAPSPELAALLAERAQLVTERATLGADRAQIVTTLITPAITARQAAEADAKRAADDAARAEAALATTTDRLDAAVAKAAAIPAARAILNAERDALAATAPPPDTTGVALEDFLLAQTAHQLEFLDAVGGEVTFGAGADAITFISSVDGKRVININALSVGLVSALSKADQEKVAGTAAWPFVADQLGLVPSTEVVGLANARQAADGIVDAVITAIVAADYGAQFVDDKDVFINQLQNMKARIADGAIFDLQQIGFVANEINTRFERAREFSLGVQNAGAPFTGLDGDTLLSGYNEFLAQERRILSADNRAIQLAKLAELGVPTLDLPQLIVELQTLFEDIAIAERDILTEDTRQHNALLRDYSIMIGRLGDTIAATDPTEPEDETAFVGTAFDRVGLLFNEAFGAPRALHPVEILNGLQTRTVFPLIGEELRRDEWENFKNQLSDTVTTLNQNSQIRQNEISQKNSQANRHFEIVSDTIRRLFDLLQTIGRNTA
ncbi:MAG: hypothetical protein AAF318_01320 [Pseudomonadota bacterium]